MGKATGTKPHTPAKKGRLGTRRMERALLGVAHLQEGAARRTGHLTAPGVEKMIKRSRVGLPVWSSALHMSTASLERKLEGKTPFGALEADRLLTVEQVLKRGMEVFEDAGDLQAWLERKHQLLENKRPMDLLGSTFGIGLVLMELGRIEHGVF